MKKRITSVIVFFIAMGSYPIFAASESKAGLSEALEKRKQGEVYDSIKIFESMLKDDPQQPRVRVELAASYYQVQEYKKASNQLQSVIQDDSANPKLKVSSHRFLKRIRSRDQQFRDRQHSFDSEVSVLSGTDSNANAGPDENALGSLNLVGNSNVLPREDSYLNTAFSLRHRYQFYGTQKWAGKPLQMLWNNRLSVTRRDYSEVDTSDILVTSIQTGPAWYSASEGWRTDLLYRVDNLRVNQEHLADFYTIEPRLTLFRDKSQWSLSASLSDRQYAQDDDEERNGERTGFGLSHSYQFSEQFSWLNRFEWNELDVEAENLSYRAPKWTTRFTYEVDEPISFYIGGSAEKLDYEAATAINNVSVVREEGVIQYQAGANFSLNDQTRFSMRYQHQERKSNLPIYEYDRERIEAALRYRF